MDIFSNLMAIGECLLDSPRTQAFKRAIDDTVRPGNSVLDVGTGSGILAMFSARAGAHRVKAIEITPEVACFARQNIAHNGLNSIVTVEEQDATTLMHSPVDVVTMELMDTWLVAEQQVAVMNQLHEAGIIGAQTRLIPQRYQNLISLVNYDFSFYGFELPFVIQARNFMARDHIRQRFCPTIIAHEISFHEKQDLRVRKSFRVPVETGGKCNAAVLTARIFLTPDLQLGATSDLNMPVIIPLEPRHVQRGQELTIGVDYVMGAGFGSFRMAWEERCEAAPTPKPEPFTHSAACHR